MFFLLRQLLIILIVIVVFSSVHAQNRCLTMELSKRRSINDHLTMAKALAEADTNYPMDNIIVIPVVVHVIHNNAGNQIGGADNPNVSDEQIFSQIEGLNNDYRRIEGTRGYNTDPVGVDSKIEFKLANRDPEGNVTSGIIRIFNATPEWNPDYDEEFKKLSAWPSESYLNIWVVNLSSNNLGFATFPSGSVYRDLDVYAETPSLLDGLTIDYAAFGTIGTAAGKYRYGRTSTHEIGHWLGLLHIWGDAKCGNDYIEDTPLQEKSSLDLLETCPVKFSKCNNVQSADMTNNYMDYSPDICMNIFTKGQMERMRKVIYTSPRRKSLLSSAGFDTILAGTSNRLYNSGITITYHQGVVNISSLSLTAEARMIVSDIFGRQILNDNVIDQNAITINMQSLPSGIYMIFITDRFRNFSMKIHHNFSVN